MVALISQSARTLLVWSLAVGLAAWIYPQSAPATSRGSEGGVAVGVNGADRWSREAVAGAYLDYASLAGAEVRKMVDAYGSLETRYRAIGETLGYPGKLDRLEAAERANARTARSVSATAMGEYKLNASLVSQSQGSLFRVREALLHYMRDWSDEGQDERKRIFGPIMDALDAIPEAERASKQVLLPGAGLGRLAWDLSELGFQTTACEYSYYMVLALRFLLNPLKTSRLNQHIIQPWAHRFSHQKQAGSIFRDVAFPDALPRVSPRFHLVEGDFFNITPPLASPAIGKSDAGYDIVVTLFFIDTSANVARTLEHIRDLLVPGGLWINLGPLLWAAAGTAALELSLDEVMQLAREVGFRVDDGAGDERRRPRTVECEYTGDREGMFKRLYGAEFWVAEKV